MIAQSGSFLGDIFRGGKNRDTAAHGGNERTAWKKPSAPNTAVVNP